MTEVARTTVPRPMEDEIIVVKVPNAIIRRRWRPQRVISAMRTRLHLEQIVRDIVVLASGRPEQLTLLRSSPEAEAFIRRLLPRLTEYKWQAKEIDL
jgi:hypothetical protein